MADLTVGKAYVQIVPTTKGISGGISKEMGGAGRESGHAFSLGMSATLTGGFEKIAGITYTAISGVMSQSMNLGAALEQNIGGIETLFGDSADTVIKNAENAFKTCGLSANEYMENVTSFSASLLQSVGGDTDKAANSANMALQDMSDNANKMGTSMQSIQNAYQGFAKQNYTMLDNLKLGYGGTKKEMERLLADATKISGVKYNLDNLDDVYSAIHVIQGEIGITGTTAEEAASTFTGSSSAVKAAYENLLAALTTGEDLDGKLFDLMNSAATFVGKNMIPMIGRVASSLVSLLPEAITRIFNVATMFIVGYDWQGLADNIINGINNFINGDSEPSKFLESAKRLLSAIGNALMTLLPQILPFIVKLVLFLAKKLVESIPKIVVTLKNFAVEFFNRTKEAFTGEAENLKSIGRDVVNGILEGLKMAWDSLTSWLEEVCGGLIDKVKSVLKIGSPSKAFAQEVGQWIPAGIAQGIDNNMGVLTRAIDDMSDMSVQTAIKSSVTSDYGTAGATGFYGGMSAVNINVYGRDGQSARDIAKEVSNIINNQIKSKRAVIA